MGAPTSTLGLVERVKAGDAEAFALLFRKYRKRLAVLIHYRMREVLRVHADIDDILQEVFLAASQQIEHFDYRAPGSFLAWLARIAEHTVIDTARFQARQKRDGGEPVRFKTPSNPGGVDLADFETPSRILLREERMRKLLEKVDELSPEQREVILLAKFEGLTTQEIAAKLGKERGAVALLLHRALKRLREVAEASHDQ